MSKFHVEIYTDGGYSIPKGVGGYAMIVVENGEVVHQYSTIEERSTSARMEIKAFIKALEYARDNYENQLVNIYTDNSYVVKGYTEWMRGWKKRKWRKSDGKPIKNLDLWQEIDKLKAPNIISNWVKGHNGDKFNELVDSLTRNYI